jgi:hypothetical protein
MDIAYVFLFLVFKFALDRPLDCLERMDIHVNLNFIQSLSSYVVGRSICQFNSMFDFTLEDVEKREKKINLILGRMGSVQTLHTQKSLYSKSLHILKSPHMVPLYSISLHILKSPLYGNFI